MTNYDRRHSDHVVGVGGMPHPEKKPERNHGEKRNHDRLAPTCWETACASSRRNRRKFKYASIPCSERADTSHTIIPGRTDSMLRFAAMPVHLLVLSEIAPS